MKNKYISWIGENDFKAINIEKTSNIGAIYAFLKSKYAKDISEYYILHVIGYKDDKFKEFIKRLNSDFPNKKFIECDFEMGDPTNYKDIYKSIISIIDEDSFYHIQTSSGTPQMSSVWLLISKTTLNNRSRLYQGNYNYKNSKDMINKIEIPFDIELDYLPDFNKKVERNLIENWNKLPSYLDIKHKSIEMDKVLSLSYRVSKLDIPVIILGETGVGKELISKAIHSSSKRNKSKMTTINCAALNDSIAEATLFGWSKGAWTGANTEGKGYFREANNSTIFLDEVGELSLNIQAKLLRVLEYGELNRVGDGRTFQVNVRIVAATNRDLIKMVKENKFRKDLFYRLNVAVIKVPALRERKDDILTIAEYFLNLQNDKLKKLSDFEYVEKKFSISAKNFLKDFSWPGNIRELYHTIERATIWGETEKIDEDLIKSMIVSINDSPIKTYNDLDLPIDLENHLKEIEKKYIEKAMIKSNKSITKASQLLGYKNYQLLQYKIKLL